MLLPRGSFGGSEARSALRILVFLRRMRAVPLDPCLTPLFLGRGHLFLDAPNSCRLHVLPVGFAPLAHVEDRDIHAMILIATDRGEHMSSTHVT